MALFAAALSGQVQPSFGFAIFAARRWRRATAADGSFNSFAKSSAVNGFVAEAFSVFVGAAIDDASSGLSTAGVFGADFADVPEFFAVGLDGVVMWNYLN
jgi:hypothetical protein